MSSIPSAFHHPSAFESGLTGIRRHRASLDRTAERISGTAPLGDLAGDMTRLTSDLRGVQANARSLRAADELVGTLLDLFA